MFGNVGASSKMTLECNDESSYIKPDSFQTLTFSLIVKPCVHEVIT
jgi:hypothetical protein